MAHEKRFGDVELKGFNPDNFIGQFYAFRRENYPDSTDMRKVLTAFIATTPWQQEGAGFIDYIDSLLRSKNSKKGWVRRKKKKETLEKKVPLLVKAKPAEISPEQRAEKRRHKQAKEAAGKIMKAKRDAALADLAERQGSLI